MSNVLRITEAASLALHTMKILSNGHDKLITTKDIAEILNASEAHLSKVMQRLVKSGLIKSTRGPKGGFILAKSAKEITLKEIYETIEQPFGENRCLLAKQACNGKNCIFGNLLESINTQVKEYFCNTKLSDFQDR